MSGRNNSDDDKGVNRLSLRDRVVGIYLGMLFHVGQTNGVVLVTRAGFRQILKIVGLSEPEKIELRGILSAVLPKK